MTAPVVTPSDYDPASWAPEEAPEEEPAPRVADLPGQTGPRVVLEPSAEPGPRPPRHSGGARPAPRPAPRSGVRRDETRGPAPARRLPPTGRLGLLWGVAIVLATVVSPLLVAVLVAPVAFVGSLSLARRGGRRSASWTLWPACAAALVPLSAVGGPIVACVALLVAVVVVTAAIPGAGDSLARSAATVAAPAVAAASLVLADHGSTGVALCLASAICLFDVANYLVGTGETGGVLGAIAGIVTVGVLAVLVAAVVNPPLSGSRPWILCGLVAALAPCGIALGRGLAQGVRLPAVRRLDSLILAGPAWVIATRILLP